ncbi:DUF916 domain-containing protein [Candidatus Woesearchaeota archaeon]|nr:DUF916 domain-containing protein [Candidatus Woesearchaeota archaeon]
MNTKKLIAVVVIVILFAVGITSFLYGSFKVHTYNDYEVLINVTEIRSISINVDTTSGYLNFGGAPRTGISYRTINLTNDYDTDLKVRFEKMGDAAEWLTVPDTFVISPGETKQMGFRINVPEDANIGLHKGTLRIFLEKI